MLERCLISSFESDDIDATMKLVRDDLATNSRGVVWCRYEQKEDGYECVRKEHLDRKDFLHEPARKWAEVGWVARGVWLTRKQGLKRFGNAFLHATFKDRKDDDDAKGQQKARVWELWHKGENIVVWVTPGVDDVLDMQPPFLSLDGFFPCPRPAFGTLKRRTMIPVPDFLYYKDQVEEINELTARISSLSESLRLKGFYPGGASDVGEAIESVLKDQDNRATLVPINSLAAFGNGSLKDSVVWLPVRDVAEVITSLVALRKQLIEDVYQITGLSDIMRGETEASETLGAQKLKSQYGSIRIRDRQQELVRLARDVTRIEAEIMAENFQPETLAQMSQTDLPTDEDIAQQITGITSQIDMARANPELMQRIQSDPQARQQAEQMLQQAQAQVQQLEQSITLEKVVSLYRDQRIRPFVLEIETDSTIQPDEDAQKQRATEFVTAVGGFLQQAVAAVTTLPESAPLAAEMLQFTASQFRAGRTLDGAIDEFADKMKQVASQPKPPPPEQVKAEAEAKAAEQEAEIRKQEAQSEGVRAQAEAQTKEVENAERMQALQAKEANDQQARELKNRQAEQDAANKQRIADLEYQLKQVQLATARVQLAASAVQAGTPQGDGEGESAPVPDAGKISDIISAVMPDGKVAADRHEETSQALNAMADAIRGLAEAQMRPKSVTTPNGKTYTVN